MSIIKTEQLSRRYGRRVGIDAVHLDIGEGEIFGFLGPNGAGKTTTIRLLLGFLRPTAGRATICGLDCWRQSPRIKRDVGYLPGDLRLYPWITGRMALKIIGRVRGVDLRTDGAELAERFRLEMDLPVRKMSRGMRQKLGLIMALVHKPRLLILDEPTSGLDPLMQIELADCLRQLASSGHTVFFSSHTLSEVETLCRRVAIVRQGRIIADQTLESLRLRAGRMVELVFIDGETAAGVELPGFLKLHRQDGRRCYCELEGPAPPLVGWAAGQALEDISISRPDLENVFRKFYESPWEPS
jgi:ABC-2 type transport system ATP-binding protein